MYDWFLLERVWVGVGRGRLVYGRGGGSRGAKDVCMVMRGGCLLLGSECVAQTWVICTYKLISIIPFRFD